MDIVGTRQRSFDGAATGALILAHGGEIVWDMADWVEDPRVWCTDIDALGRWCIDGLGYLHADLANGICEFVHQEERVKAPRTVVHIPRVVWAETEHPPSGNEWRGGWLFYHAWQTGSRTAYLEGTLSWKNMESPPADVNPKAPDLELRIDIHRNGQHSWDLSGDDVTAPFSHVEPLPAPTVWEDPATVWDGLLIKVGPETDEHWDVILRPSYYRGG